MQKPVLFYVQNDFADWEASFILPLLHRRGLVKVVGETGEPVRSLGGLRILPDAKLSDVKPAEFSGMILPGGDFWVDASANKAALKFAKDVFAEGGLVAGICAATVALARQGFMNDLNHTSNLLSVLKQLVPDYRGEALYQQDRLAVTDKNLITAGGIGALEFTVEIMSYFKMYEPQIIHQWYELFKRAVQPPPEFWNQDGM